MNQFGCPYAKDAKSKRAGTGGPPDGTFVNLKTKGQERRSNGGNIKDECIDRTSNEPGTLSMANTGAPNSGAVLRSINDAPVTRTRVAMASHHSLHRALSCRILNNLQAAPSFSSTLRTTTSSTGSPQVARDPFMTPPSRPHSLLFSLLLVNGFACLHHHRLRKPKNSVHPPQRSDRTHRRV